LNSRTKPNVYIIAGSNGAGKTTFAKEFLPLYAKCHNFINADLIAQGLSPFEPEGAAIKAGRLVLEQIRKFSQSHFDFGFETTLSGRTYMPILRELKTKGFVIHLFYLWIPSVNLALSRIKERVASGGHNVPEADVRRRFSKSLYNFLAHYKNLADYWTIFNNSTVPPTLIARADHNKVEIFDKAIYQSFSNRKEVL
jgi:predicted ABC-type ATPase